MGQPVCLTVNKVGRGQSNQASLQGSVICVHVLYLHAHVQCTPACVRTLVFVSPSQTI